MNTKKDTIEKLFYRLRDEFDIEEPGVNHKERFLKKLNDTKSPKRRNRWKTLSIAASIAFLSCVGIGVFYNGIKTNTAEVVSEIEEAQFYFASLLQEEIEKVNAQSSPDTKQIIDDTMRQLHKLEQSYQQLRNDLMENGNSKQILHAMITNFQTRINLLQDVLIQIDEIKNLKSKEHETTTI